MEARQSLNIGAINPYALAEIVLGRDVAWETTPHPERVVEEALATPWEDLFDPRTGSLLYTGLCLEDGRVMRRLSRDEARRAIRPRDGTVSGNGFEPRRSHRLSDVLRNLLATSNAPSKTTAEWHPPHTDWHDLGGCWLASEPGDPVQGALGDSYFVAALNAVAWARPELVLGRPRRDRSRTGVVIDRLVLHLGDGRELPVEVSERVPVTHSAHRVQFARSSRSGESWPAVWEKAYAKWTTGTRSDQPEYPRLVGGDPVSALAVLVGGDRRYLWTRNRTGQELWEEVRRHAAGRKAIDPMVAWTHPSSTAAPDTTIDYSRAGLVANHAYAVLGWAEERGEGFLVLRNPWGRHVPRVGVLEGDWEWVDAAGRQRLRLGERGIFALGGTLFQRYFAGLGTSRT